MRTHHALLVVCAGLVAGGLHGAAVGGFVSVPVQAAGSQPLISINPKLNLDTPTETQDRANSLGTLSGATRTAMKASPGLLEDLRGRLEPAGVHRSA